MADFKITLILGTELAGIRNLIDQLEGLHFGILINSLRWESQIEGEKRKKEYYKSIKENVIKINKRIKDFNILLKRAFDTKYYTFRKLEQIKLSSLDKIIKEHRGEFPRNKKEESYIKYVMAEDSSPSSLARKHTSVLLSNALLPTKLSISNFAKGFDKLYEPFGDYNSLNIRSKTINDITKAEVCYTNGLAEEAVFILGRTVERLSIDCLKHLKKLGRVNKTYSEIDELNFENSINLLSSPKIKVFRKDQKPKALALKWDRNIYGHKRSSPSKMKEKDMDSMIKIGINIIERLEKKLRS
ncbi:hypothetical protein KKH23_03645 [Patescibacteria group bacterium]|nr:hypothetical protein [Patescibacteria group bacterium]MBU0776862.1 hypothetical protein [Patescibacteria group bacterium]MBU0846259.1 hypothetical protein [Patescibacteria group bacterium]MBU0922606.1 hypothetical protein [Patescibacteria group bacterium]MBU1066657.1 hypothetical protein [Patescibacteria group bacterium]